MNGRRPFRSERTARRQEGALPRASDEAIRPDRTGSERQHRSRFDCGGAGPKRNRRGCSSRRDERTGSAGPVQAAHRPELRPESVPTSVSAAPKTIVIESPMVGTYFSSSAPDAPPFVSVGSVVHAETIVCIIEAMKVFTDIPAGVSGTIAAILVKNGQPVEFGQPLFRLIPS